MTVAAIDALVDCIAVAISDYMRYQQVSSMYPPLQEFIAERLRERGYGTTLSTRDVALVALQLAMFTEPGDFAALDRLQKQLGAIDPTWAFAGREHDDA